MGQQGSYQPNASDWQTVFAAAGSSAAQKLSGELAALAQTRTFVTKIRPGAFTAIGNKLRAILMPQLTDPYTLSSLYAGPAVSIVDYAWQFSAASQLLFSAAGTVSLDSTAAQFESDSLDYLLDGGTGLCIAGNLPVGAKPRYLQNLGDDVITFVLDNVTEASSLAKSGGYTPLPGVAYLIDRIEAANA